MLKVIFKEKIILFEFDLVSFLFQSKIKLIAPIFESIKLIAGIYFILHSKSMPFAFYKGRHRYEATQNQKLF